MEIDGVDNGCHKTYRQACGLEELGDGIWRIYFRQKMLGYFDEKKLRIMDELGRLKRNYV